MSAIGDFSQAIGDDLEAIIFGNYINEYLENGSLSGIYIKDKRFGNIDDIVFEINHTTLHFIQAKGSMQDKEITLGYFFTKEKKTDGSFKESFIQKLYNSYNSIKNEFSNKTIKIEIIFALQPSNCTRYVPEKNGNKITFAFFIREVWKPFKSGNLQQQDILNNEIYKVFLEKKGLIKNRLIPIKTLIDLFILSVYNR